MQKKIDYFKILKCTSTLKKLSIVFNRSVGQKLRFEDLDLKNF